MSGLPAGLDDAWLRGVLDRAGYGGPQASLVSVAPVGQGNTSHVVQLTLDQGQTLVAKLPRLLANGSKPSGDIFGYGRELAA